MNWIAIGSINAGLSIIMGAFGAHALKSILSENSLEVFHTAAQYHGMHALGLILMGLYFLYTQTEFTYPAILLLMGIILFSGSLYALAITGITWLGAITPIGGISFILGWISFSYLVWKNS
ncbi:MAG: hypothetical protein CL678_11265 [Bdellovibrionaceae bacterium]|nr:hypothetical protein [Pseudobdellovibrionaceae bacterium]|tara:strand:- start:630 stop:992 length:363 start_codon:yes stop_codon:yes gene_type:complete